MKSSLRQTAMPQHRSRPRLNDRPYLKTDEQLEKGAKREGSSALVRVPYRVISIFGIPAAPRSFLHLSSMYFSSKRTWAVAGSARSFGSVRVIDR